MSDKLEQQRLEEAQKRDHHKLGRELRLFMFSPEVGSGLPLWLPRGAILRDVLERFLRQEQLDRGYLPVVTPHIGRIELYKTSGHWYKYRDHMFPPMVEPGTKADEADSGAVPDLSSLERTVALLLEHYAGAFPVWLAPVQAMVIPIADRHQEYANQVMEVLKQAGVRVEVDTRSERMNAKIRDAQVQKIPYLLVVGDKEAEGKAVSVRLRTNVNLGVKPLASFVERIMGIIKKRSGEL